MIEHGIFTPEYARLAVQYLVDNQIGFNIEYIMEIKKFTIELNGDNLDKEKELLSARFHAEWFISGGYAEEQTIKELEHD